MEYIENDNYHFLETPFTKNLEEFETYYKDKWEDHLSNKELKIMQDAYCVGISEMRVEKDLCQGDYVSIYKNIIISTRSLECQAQEQQDRAWVVQLKRTRMYYQTELLKALTSTMQYFCMEN